MNDVGAAFRKKDIEEGGKTYVVERPNFKTEAAYTDYLEKRALAVIKRNRAVLAEDYQENFRGWQRDCAAGVYAWGTVTAAESLRGEECFKEYLYILLGQNTPDISRTEFLKLWDAKTQGGSSNELVDAFNEVMAPTPTTPPPEAGEKS